MAKKRYIYFWLYYLIGYIFPFVYFLCKLGVTKKVTSIVMPVVLLAIVAIIKLCTAIPTWTSTLRPSMAKGILHSIPIYLLFILLITLGLILKYTITAQVQEAFILYFEVVLILFGSLIIASVPRALHMKYRELDLIAKGYVIGVVRK
jgi:uncharacterized membrane protein YhaH (DUF805 family)